MEKRIRISGRLFFSQKPASSERIWCSGWFSFRGRPTGVASIHGLFTHK